jgi:hypothetical protein
VSAGRQSVVVLALCAAGLFVSHARAAGPLFTAAELRADLAQLDRALHEMPPDLAHSANVPQVERAIRDMDVALAASPPLDRDAAWRLFATLNPLLADGHLFIGFVDWRADTRAHLDAGGVLFPFAMRVTPDCQLNVRAEPPGQPSPLVGARLLAVNGVGADALCEQLLARLHGDTRAFRADLLSRRFFFFYWKVFGAPASFDLQWAGAAATQRVAGSARLPQLLADESSFARQFRLQYVGDQPAAVLTLGTFAWPDEQQVLDFTRDAFMKIHDRHVHTLIIDVRDNGGGNDAEWIEGVMPYIATRPFRTASRVRKRVVVADPAKHETLGSVVERPVDAWFPPGRGNPKFKGQVYVVTGTGTYSSAVVFANVTQDFGFARIAGPAGSARASVSGGARRTTLTHTGLIVVAPRFVLERPSGAHEPELFTPDIDFDDSQPLSALADRAATHR